MTPTNQPAGDAWEPNLEAMRDVAEMEEVYLSDAKLMYAELSNDAAATALYVTAVAIIGERLNDLDRLMADRPYQSAQRPRIAIEGMVDLVAHVFNVPPDQVRDDASR
ncbi:MAG TPA: hypothetical protein VH475_23955 [Tepidisphaeraceae bacterium]|jgi:hypothetical protein